MQLRGTLPWLTFALIGSCDGPPASSLGPDAGPPAVCTSELAPGPGAPTSTAPIVGGFVRDTAFETMIAAATPPPDSIARATSHGLFVDLDNDGQTELIFQVSQNIFGGGGKGAWLLRRTVTGELEFDAALPGAVQACQFAADLDADGWVDLFCTFPDRRVIWNSAGGLLWDQPLVLENVPSPMASTPWDVDNDGLLDIVISNWGSPNRVYRNRGQRAFDEVAAAWGLAQDGLTWQVAFSDLNFDQEVDAYVGNDGETHENFALRRTVPGDDGTPRFEVFSPEHPGCPPTTLFGISSHAPMGITHIDTNRDGIQELTFALTLSVPTLTPVGTSHWVDASDDIGLTLATTTTGQFLVSWSPLAWDIDHDGMDELIVMTGDSEGFDSLPNRGQSRVYLFRGLNDGHFTDVAESLGINELGQFFTVHRGDVDGDGELDLLIGGFGQPMRVYRSRLTQSFGHVLVELRGTTSNAEGLGAVVIAAAGELQHQHVVGGRFSPQVTERPVVDVALGTSGTLDELRIQWPSGYEQHIGPIAAGDHMVVTEPELIGIVPASRHLPADGIATATITVRPVDPRGVPLGEANVTIESPFVAAQWTGSTMRQVDGAFTRTLRAPAAAGSVVVQVSIDGQMLAVRPRVWFDPAVL